jgi:hypothetical protein
MKAQFLFFGQLALCGATALPVVVRVAVRVVLSQILWFHAKRRFALDDIDIPIAPPGHRGLPAGVRRCAGPGMAWE